SHWLSEAAHVWSTTLGDVHRAAKILKSALERDPTQNVAAERLAQIYRDKGDVRSLAGLLQHPTKALAPLAQADSQVRSDWAGLHEELGRLLAEPPLSQPKMAIESYKRALECDPQSAYAMYNVRELLKQQGSFQEALGYYEMELGIEQDPARRV